MKHITFLYNEFINETTPAVINYLREDKAKEIAPFFKYINDYSECFEDDGYYFNFKDITDYDVNKTNQIYVFDLMRSIFNRCVNDLSESTLKLLRDHQIPMLFYFPSEGFEFEYYLWIDYIQKQLTEQGLDKNLKFLIFGTGYLTQQFYDAHIEKFSHQEARDIVIEQEWLDKDFFDMSHRSKFTRCFGVNFFEHFHYEKLKDSSYYNSKKYQKQLAKILDTEYKNKNFVCLNRNLRYHRLALISELCRHGLHTSNHVTLIGGTMLEPGTGECWKVEEYILKDSLRRSHFNKFVKNFKPLTSLYVKDSGLHNDLFLPPIRYYQDTFYSLITETEVSDNTLFLSEKILKPMSFYHPFLLLGTPFSLKYLRSLGYETFPEFFDESYDEEKQLDKRFDMVMQQVLEFQKLKRIKKVRKFNSIIDKLQHNKKLCDERMFRSNYTITVESLDDILKIITKS